MLKKFFFVISTVIFTTGCAYSSAKSTGIDWPVFMAKQDMVWTQMPTQWEQAPFFGNGNMGSMVYQTGDNKMRLQLFRVDVQDHRDNTYGWTAYSRPRFDLGSFYMTTEGKIKGADLRLNLWDATLAGTITTDKGKISVFHLVHSEDMAAVFKTEIIEGTEKLTCSWLPGKAETTRKGYPKNEKEKQDFAKRYGGHYLKTLKPYTPNPEPVITKDGDFHVCTQNLLVGGQYATAWQVIDESQKDQTLIASVCKSYPERTAKAEAIDIVNSLIQKPSLSNWIAVHKQWWNDYYQQSFVSLPDARTESMYWIQVYKMACATRSDRPVMDTAGPWFQPTPWPYITWDLNVQLCYWPTYASNRISLAKSLPRTLNEHKQNLIENVLPEEWQADSAYVSVTSTHDLRSRRNGDRRYYHCVGNLPWAMHNCWLQYRHTMNDDMLKEQVFPLLKRSMNLYFHLCYEGDDGKIHLPKTYSPEYGGLHKDCNYDLALFKWGCQTLLWTCDRLNIDDPLIPRWKDVTERLVDYPVNENGYMLGSNSPYKNSHRHYSHLLMIYPLYQVNVDDPDSYEVMEKSLKHWIGLERSLRGYSFTGASSISSALGNGDDSLRYLKGLERFLQPNTLYKESGPCMETPLSAAQSVHDMILQSWGNTIRIFPSISSKWKDVEFTNMLAEGAFEVSASRRDGKTNWVRIKSLQGEKGFSVIPNINGFQIIKGKSAIKVADESSSWVKRRYSLDLAKDKELLIVRTGYQGPLTAVPVENQIGKKNSFGLNSDQY